METMSIFFTGVFVGLSFGWGLGTSDIENRTQDKCINWVEDCWPNKPSWIDPEGTCWINGQRVIVNTERE